MPRLNISGITAKMASRFLLLERIGLCGTPVSSGILGVTSFHRVRL